MEEVVGSGRVTLKQLHLMAGVSSKAVQQQTCSMVSQGRLRLEGRGVKGSPFKLSTAKADEVEEIIRERIVAVLAKSDEEWVLHKPLITEAKKGHRTLTVSCVLAEMAAAGILERRGEGNKYSPYTYRLPLVEGAVEVCIKVRQEKRERGSRQLWICC